MVLRRPVELAPFLERWESVLIQRSTASSSFYLSFLFFPSGLRTGGFNQAEAPGSATTPSRAAQQSPLTSTAGIPSSASDLKSAF